MVLVSRPRADPGLAARPPAGPPILARAIMSSLRPRAAAAAAGRATRSRSGSRSRPASPARDEGGKRAATASRLTDLSRASATVAGAGDASPAAVYPPPPALAAGAMVPSLDEYRRMHAESLADPAKFWGGIAAEFHWHKPWEPAFTRCEMGGGGGGLVAGRGGGRGVRGRAAGGMPRRAPDGGGLANLDPPPRPPPDPPATTLT